MGIEASALGFIRGIVSEPNRYALPMAPQIANYATVGAYGAGGFGFMNNTYSQSVINYLAIDQDTVARYVDYEDQDDSPLCSSALDIYCLAGDTKVPLLDGRTLTIKEISEMQSLENLWIYSSDGKQLVPAKIKSAQQTGKQVKVMKITLDDGTVIRATPNHKFMKRDGEFVELQDLRHGDSLMPLYRATDSRGYEKVYDGKKYEFTHRWSYRHAVGKLPKNKGNKIEQLSVIHHVDFNKKNNNPENLQVMPWLDHKRIYNEHGSDFKLKIFNMAPKRNPGTFKNGADVRINHKVVSVEFESELFDVYDLTIDSDTHCFAAGDGNGFVIVHNCDDSCQVDPEMNRTVWITSQDETIRKDLDEMVLKKMMAEENIWMNTRILLKYGNLFQELVVKKGHGIVGVNPLPPPTMRRIEIGTGSEAVIGFMYDPTATFRISTMDFVNKLQARIQDGGPNISDHYRHAQDSMVFEDWEIIHSRLRGKNAYSQYGYGIFEPARWIYKRLVLLEDSLVMYRITRAPSRYAFYIDVSSIPPNEAPLYLNKVRQSLKQTKYTNNQTNKQDLKFNALSPQDDFFLPVRDGKESTRVESLTGPVYDAIEDVKYFESKLFAALKVPKPFLTYEESTAKTNLSAEDTRFARTIMRIQREVKNSYRKACRVHLSAKGINPDKVEFEVNMTIPSAIFELAQLEIRNAELELAEKYGAYAPKSWILKHVLKYSDEQVEEMERMRKAEAAKGPEDEDQPESHGSSGAIDRVTSRLHDKSETVPVAVNPGESREYKMSGDEYWNGGLKKNLNSLVERLEEAKHRDKVFAQRWTRMTSLLEEVRQTIKR